MNSKTRLYKDLERLTSESTQPSFRLQAPNGLSRLMHRLIRALTASHEPKIHQIQARDGQILFEGYDPVTNDHIQTTSEEEVRIWLEQRYNR